MVNINDFTTVTGKLMRSSDAHQFTFNDRKSATDYFHLDLATEDHRQIQVSLNIKAMGYSGELNKSKIWYWNSQKKRAIKTAIANPSRYIGKKLRVTGHLVVVNAEDNIYKMTNVQQVILYP